ncbi:relaxase [Dickeya fangzhongdai]|uniref:MobH family relaxase n=1 Tax=Dickeya fangzhongdai TaxID=1778540 RepID=UPI00057498CF|nr:MobH family relaxase [Dickeya fangzhongdai]KHN52915.1 relaxase [Dickeya fangzhongdai]
MLSLFQRKKPAPPAPPPIPALTPKGLLHPESATSLLATPRRQKLLEHIWQRTSLSRRQFATLYQAPLMRYAGLVQHFPASESHHHAYQGGMLDHGLEIVAFALKLRQSYMLPVGTTPEDQAIQSEAWTAAIAYAALLHDIGKIAVDLHVEHEDGSFWHPWHGPLTQPYRFHYRDDREYRLHSAATGLLCHQLLDRYILDWLSEYPTLWASLIYVLAGQYEHAGLLGELVIQADRASVAQDLGGDPARAIAAPKHALQRKLLEGLRYLLKKELKLNQSQASDGWLTEDVLWLVSKTVSDKLRAHLLSQGIEGIPTSNTTIFNVLQDHGMLQTTSDGKAIWRATVNSATGWSHSFTLLKLSPALIWQANERPDAFTGSVVVEIDSVNEEQPAQPNESGAADIIPETTTSTPPISEKISTEQQHISPTPDAIADLLTLFDMSIQESEIDTLHYSNTPPSTSDETQKQTVSPKNRTPVHTVPAGSMPLNNNQAPSAEHFIYWLKQSISSHKLIINDAKALVHTVNDRVYLVSPGVFQRYAQEYPSIAALAKQEKQQDWQWIQKRFERLQFHLKQPNGLNIWTCTVTGPRKSRQLHGYLLSKPEILFSERVPNNPYLSLA